MWEKRPKKGHLRYVSRRCADDWLEWDAAWGLLHSSAWHIAHTIKTTVTRLYPNPDEPDLNSGGQEAHCPEKSS